MATPVEQEFRIRYKCHCSVCLRGGWRDMWQHATVWATDADAARAKGKLENPEAHVLQVRVR